MLVLGFLNACSSVPQQGGQWKVSKSGEAVHDALVDHYEAWRGVPYRLGGTGRNGIDCSAYVQRVYDDAFGVRLPRTTIDQLRLGEPVSRNRLVAGDLVFFSPSGKTRHVGVFLADNLFLHAGTSTGVTVSALDSPYWASSYITGRRLLRRD